MKRLTLAMDIPGVESALNKLSTAENLHMIELKETLLILMHNTPSVNLAVAKIIAEMTKTPEQRTKFSDIGVLEKLNELLSVALANRKENGNLELIVQLCRALGNIFYSNDDARNVIFHLDGGRVLIDLLDVSTSEIEKADEREFFAKVRGGVVSNYLLGNEELSQKAIELGVVSKMKTRIEETDEGLEHLLPLFSILTEQVSDLTFPPEILILIAKILKRCTNSVVVEACLELLLCQAESDEVKLILAKEELTEHIFNSLDKYKAFADDVDAKSLVKLACDLIVLVLTGGEIGTALEFEKNFISISFR